MGQFEPVPANKIETAQLCSALRQKRPLFSRRLDRSPEAAAVERGLLQRLPCRFGLVDLSPANCWPGSGAAFRWCRRPERLAVLAIGYDGLIYDLPGRGDAARDAGDVTSLGEHPRRSKIPSDKFDDKSQRDIRPCSPGHGCSGP